LLPGERHPVYVGDRPRRSLLAAPRPVKSPLDRAADSVNNLFETFVKGRGKSFGKTLRNGDFSAVLCPWKSKGVER
ncbi:hypothetical protein, partial [Sphingobium sp. YR768]|uniref:hypothetical protein n=1 Tax=Sphingobium sp. YR768 TaxID=1884365 RepID=UPI001C42F800